jgi:hypothetical protein
MGISASKVSTWQERLVDRNQGMYYYLLSAYQSMFSGMFASENHLAGQKVF